MKTFRVEVKDNYTFTLLVKAENQDQAEQVAEEYQSTYQKVRNVNGSQDAVDKHWLDAGILLHDTVDGEGGVHVVQEYDETDTGFFMQMFKGEEQRLKANGRKDK